MIASKVIRDNRRHISRADYNDKKPYLDTENVSFPEVGSLQSRALRKLFPAGIMLTHRGFDSASHSYRLSGYIDNLRDKGWTIVNHDEIGLTKDTVRRSAKFTRYELYAEFSPDLQAVIEAFCLDVDAFVANEKSKEAK